METVFRILCHPLFMLCLLLGLGIANLWRKRVESRRRLWWVTIAFIALVLACTSAASQLLFGFLEWPYRECQVPSTGVEAIVVLGGAGEPAASEGTKLELGPSSYYRCLHALDLYASTGKPLVVVSGGAIGAWKHRMPLAQAMRDFLVGRGVDGGRIVTEEKSETTHENAAECGRLLRARGIQHVILVTDAMHMARAAGCFRKEGIEVEPAPCDFVTARFTNRVVEYLPSPVGADHMHRVLHEYLGLAYYWLRGWL